MRFCTLCRRAAPGGATICSYDGSQLTGEVDLDPAPGVEVAGYRLLDVISHGDTGTVYRAEDASQNSVALKLLAPALSGTPAVMHRIRRETKNAIKLASANVARVIDCGDHDGRFYVAREWVEGHPLSVALREEGQMEVGRAAAIAYQVCAGLALVHRVGLVHRDLKPNHVLLCEAEPGSWTVKLIDIGLAAKVDDVQAARDVYGSTLYLSPEQAEGKLVSFRSDLYSLGCLLFEMLAGTPPWRGSSQELLEQHRSAAPPALESLRGDVPEPLAQLTAKLLSKQASARPFSAAMVQRELERVVPACKEPLAPVSTGKARPDLGAVSSPAAAPAGGGMEDLGMAQTLFGGTSADVDALAAAAMSTQATPAPAASQPEAVEPELPLQSAAPVGAPAPGSQDFNAPTAFVGDQPVATPQAAAAQPMAAPAPAAPPQQPMAAPAAPPQQPTPAFPPQAGAEPPGGTHKKTMLGFPVVVPQQMQGNQPGAPPAAQPPGAAPVDAMGATAGAGAQPGGDPTQPHMAAGAMAQQPGMQPGAAIQPGMQPGAPAPAAPGQQPYPGAPAGSGVEPAQKSSSMKWILIGVGIFLFLVFVSAVIGVVSCFVLEPVDSEAPASLAPLVELLVEEELTSTPDVTEART